jgi:hypothetical protein
MPGATPVKAFPFPLLTEVVTHQSTEDLAQAFADELDLQDIAEGLALGRPACSARRVANQSIPDGVDTVITMDGEVYDTDGLVDIATNPTRISVPSGLEGMWYVHAEVGSANSTSWTKSQLSVRRAGVTGVLRKTFSAASLHMLVSGVVWIPPGGSYLELMVLHSGGGATNVASVQFRATRLTA